MSKVNLRYIIWNGSSSMKLFLASLGLFIGLSLSLLSILFYWNFSSVMGQQGGLSSYVIVNKPVGILNAFVNTSGFKTADRVDLLEVPSVEDVAIFRSNTFKVSASTTGEYQFYTELFLDALPPQFIDTKEDNFSWEKEQEIVPVILSRDFLNLYNFGFAASQGLPQLTPSALELVTIQLNISGKGKQTNYKARVVGLSDRISSLLVPLSFMEHNNKMYGEHSGESSRMIIKSNDPSNPDFLAHLQSKGWEVNKDKMKANKLTGMVRLIVGGIILLGVVMLLLAVGLMVAILNEQLYAAKRDLIRLREIGYDKGTLSSSYIKHALPFLIGAYLTTVLVLFIVGNQMYKWLQENAYLVDNKTYYIIVIPIVLLILNGVFLRVSLQKKLN